ncbi:MAG: DUF5685 family protein [Lachnospiraceae bacterium]|nr:DUF5685 family protein [Lachnospiraceae bacterium]
MFGYINVNRETLSEEDRKIYQGYYCGLCEALKNMAGKKGRFMLNYDMTFLILILTGMYEPREEKDTFRCNYHPFNKRDRIKNCVTEYAAAMDIMLSYHKLNDDVKDEGSRVKEKIKQSLTPLYRELSMKYRRQAQAIENYMEEVYAAEKRKEADIFTISSYTGKVMEEIFLFKENDLLKEDLLEMAFALGQFIYIMDAYQDLEKDIKNDNYNPLRYRLNENREVLFKIVDGFLIETMGECAMAFERLPILKNGEIIRNIIYSGVWTKYNLLKKKRTNL